jgi:hypothetical protein
MTTQRQTKHRNLVAKHAHGLNRSFVEPSKKKKQKHKKPKHKHTIED